MTVQDFKSLDEDISSHCPGEGDGGGSEGVGSKIGHETWWLTYYRNYK